VNKFSRIASIGSSKAMSLCLLLYLWLKTLVNPVFTPCDIEMARTLENNYDWLKILWGANIWNGMNYLPEARSDLLFELGLYFPKEKP
jgi:hypothetical protein